MTAKDHVSLRIADFKDLSEICRLFLQGAAYHADHAPYFFKVPSQAWALEFLKAQLRNPNVSILIAEFGGAIVGQVRLEIRKSPDIELLRPCATLQIEEIVVDEEHRRRGIARRLIAGAEEHAANLGIAQITLNVWKFNVAAEHLYSELGYTVQRSIMKKDL